MGCYDEILLACPHCGEAYILQSKAHHCDFSTYTDLDAPMQILDDIKDTPYFCKNCNRGFILDVIVWAKVRKL